MAQKIARREQPSGPKICKALNEQMGQHVSRPECNIPTRMLLGISNARQIAQNCARHKILWMWGFLGMITIAIVVGYLYTRSKGPSEFKVPAWLIAVPVALAILYAAREYSTTFQQINTDNIEYQLSGMSKKDYLNYKIGDDRTNTSFGASAMSSGLLSGTNVLGPFLRADAR